MTPAPVTPLMRKNSSQYIQILANSTILFVSESEFTCRSFQYNFSAVQTNLITVQSYENVVKAATENHADVIVIDFTSGQQSTISLCQKLNANFLTTSIPILAITPTRDWHLLEDYVDDFVDKPYPRTALIRRMAHLIHQQQTANQNRQLLHDLRRYISSAAIDGIQQHKGVELVHATVLFSDMRGFTAASFHNEISDLFQAINDTMRFQSEIILECGGYVDSFSGDGLLAVFDGRDGVVSACKAAIKIMRYAKSNAVKFWNPLPIGIGINCGSVMRGDIGSETRMTHTIIGSMVNVSARLCGIASAQQTIVSQEVADQTKEHFNFSKPQTVELKGLPHPVAIYSLELPE